MCLKCANWIIGHCFCFIDFHHVPHMFVLSDYNLNGGYHLTFDHMRFLIEHPSAPILCNLNGTQTDRTITQMLWHAFILSFKGNCELSWYVDWTWKYGWICRFDRKCIYDENLCCHHDLKICRTKFCFGRFAAIQYRSFIWVQVHLVTDCFRYDIISLDRGYDILLSFMLQIDLSLINLFIFQGCLVIQRCHVQWKSQLLWTGYKGVGAGAAGSPPPLPRNPPHLQYLQNNSWCQHPVEQQLSTKMEVILIKWDLITPWRIGGWTLVLMSKKKIWL